MKKTAAVVITVLLSIWATKSLRSIRNTKPTVVPLVSRDDLKKRPNHWPSQLIERNIIDKEMLDDVANLINAGATYLIVGQETADRNLLLATTTQFYPTGQKIILEGQVELTVHTGTFGADKGVGGLCGAVADGYWGTTTVVGASVEEGLHRTKENLLKNTDRSEKEVVKLIADTFDFVLLHTVTDEGKKVTQLVEPRRTPKKAVDGSYYLDYIVVWDYTGTSDNQWVKRKNITKRLVDKLGLETSNLRGWHEIASNPNGGVRHRAVGIEK